MFSGSCADASSRNNLRASGKSLLPSTEKPAQLNKESRLLKAGTQGAHRRRENVQRAGQQEQDKVPGDTGVSPVEADISIGWTPDFQKKVEMQILVTDLVPSLSLCFLICF